jgi:inhibitor of cysteine peptidase
MWWPAGAVRALVGIAGLTLSLGCAGKHASGGGVPSTLVVERSDRGRLLQLIVGQELQIQLPADPASGFQWIIREGAESFIRQQGAPVFTTQEARIGVSNSSPALANFRFIAHTSGEGELRFEYRDPANAQAGSRAWYRIQVRPADAPSAVPEP